MKTMKYLLAIVLAITATTWTVAVPTSARETSPQTQSSTALERGYRTGYSDGYQAGYKDQAERAAREYASKEEYQKADRAYAEAWGPLEDYRDGYQQGYELGYGAGFEREQFNSALPTGFKKRGTTEAQNGAQSNSGTTADPNQNSQTTAPANPSANMNGNISIPHDTTLVVELENAMSTSDSHRGDPFQARVVEPREYAGATIEGRVNRVQRAGKLKGTAELQLSFDQIRLPDNRSANFHAEVVEVIPNSGSTGVGDVDREGGVKGKGSTRDDVTKIGAATGIGAIIGAIAGGGTGAAIGAAIGGSVGTAGVLSSRGKDLRLARGQQLRIRTLTDISIQ
jgi:hypothetical protein